MEKSLFNYHLPENLIAQTPLPERDQSRLLCLGRNSGAVSQSIMHHFADELSENDLLLFNNTKVIPARLYAQKETGGKVEILLERQLDEETIVAHVGASKALKPGARIRLQSGEQLQMLSRQDDLFVLQLMGGHKPVMELFIKYGHMPLPPYIKRDDNAADADRYQTVYAKTPGAVAAPTAGLHFNDYLLKTIADKGVDTDFVTLHVGSGTFLPVRAERLEDHVMHHEHYEVSQQVCEKIVKTKARGGRVIAVGTTVVRCLESMAQISSQYQPITGETDIFIYPGYQFKIVDALLTNFHLPESTLLMLVCAFAGQQDVLRAYEYAVDQQFRFFSYGDAMFIA